MKKLTIEFENQEALKHFAEWLCGSGEQQYWIWMEHREQKESGNITAIEFNYHGIEDETKAKSDPKRYGKFMCDNTIRTVLGRLDKE